MSLAARSKLAEQLAVYFVADPEQAQRDLGGDVVAAIDGGVTMVQLRAKTIDDTAFRSLATEILAICRDRGVPFIVNDRFEVALAVGADGVHLGGLDLQLDEARRRAGAPFIIGSSPTDVAQAAAARELGADY